MIATEITLQPETSNRLAGLGGDWSVMTGEELRQNLCRELGCRRIEPMTRFPSWTRLYRCWFDTEEQAVEAKLRWDGE